MKIFLDPWLFPFCAALSFSISIFLLLQKKILKYSKDNQVQDSHIGVVCRYGGVGLIGSLVTCILIKWGLSEKVAPIILSYLFLACGIFITGFIDDLKGHFSPSTRLCLLISFAAIALQNFGLLKTVDVGFIDHLLGEYAWFAAFFTVFAVVGLTNATNIIDGMNGLAVGFAMLVLVSLSFVSSGDAKANEISFLVNLFLSALVGFAIVNIPKGKVILGDGGAYLVGFSIAEFCIHIHSRNENISSWFFLLLVSYPVIETVFSILRRLASRSNLASPDRMHLHQIVHSNYIRRYGAGTPQWLPNFLAAVSVLVIPLCSTILAITFRYSDLALMVSCLVIVLIYLSFLSIFRTRM